MTGLFNSTSAISYKKKKLHVKLIFLYIGIQYNTKKFIIIHTLIVNNQLNLIFFIIIPLIFRQLVDYS